MPQIQIYAQARLPTQHGIFQAVSFRDQRQNVEHLAVVQGEVAGARQVTTRIHSECLTGDVFDSLRCDCRQQLEMALGALAKVERGVIIYMRQEGRGIGLANKIAAYALQDQGLDTVEANLHLGFDDDLRSYEVAAGIIHALGIVSVDLYTNNLRKVEGLESHGVVVERRLPIIITANPYNRRYLDVKKRKSGHLLDDDK